MQIDSYKQLITIRNTAPLVKL